MCSAGVSIRVQMAGRVSHGTSWQSASLPATGYWHSSGLCLNTRERTQIVFTNLFTSKSSRTSSLNPAGSALAESHQVTFVNSCGTGTPQFLYAGGGGG
ncbi:hypothetical protein FIBSPDRAFT_1028100 [Athelia psychrophila]|uniref:Uncharacterized protein n=1 Tax=Athelia psychrophila TaxID=1759441 RepID=A0A166GZ32_9AGAM|nr:hypothetical protein FIBSPDRAFT_1028100 [Fibularhizoctonia sp. CBS 109695]